MVSSGSQIIPSYGAAFRRLLQLEENYRISLKLWISLNEETDGTGYFKVHIAGSGDIFDHIPAPLGQAAARIITAFEDPFCSALWQCLDQLESGLQRHAGYLVLPPSQ